MGGYFTYQSGVSYILNRSTLVDLLVLAPTSSVLLKETLGSSSESGVCVPTNHAGDVSSASGSQLHLGVDPAIVHTWSSRRNLYLPLTISVKKKKIQKIGLFARKTTLVTMHNYFRVYIFCCFGKNSCILEIHKH